MKQFLLIFFLIFFVFPIGSLALIVALVYDGGAIDDIPLHLYVEDSDAMAMLYDSLDTAFAAARATDDADFELDVSQDVINTVIYNTIRGKDGEGMNPSYTGPVEGCAPEECYVMTETVDMDNQTIHLRVTGMWVTFEEDRFSGNVGLEIQYNEGFTYRTTVRVRMSFVDDDDAYTVQFDRLRLGRLPLPRWLFTPIIGLFEGAVDTDPTDGLDEDIDAVDFDLSNLRVTVEKEGLTNMLLDEDEEQSVLRVFLNVLFDPEYEIVKFKLLDETFRFTARLSLVRNTDATTVPAYLDGFDYEDFDYEQHLRAQFEAFIFNMALTGNTAITIHETTLNKIIHQTFSGFEEMKFEHAYEQDGVEETLHIGLVGLWFEFHVDGTERYLEIKALFDIAGIKSLLSIRADEVVGYAGAGFAFDLQEIAFGKEPDKDYLSITDLQPFKKLLSDLDDFPFGYIDDDFYIVINTDILTDLMQDASSAIEVTEVVFVQGGIRIDIEATEPALQGILDDFADKMKDVFTHPGLQADLDVWLAANPGDATQGAYDAAMNIQATLDGGDEPDLADVADLLDHYADMTPEEQDGFLDVFIDLLPPGAFDDFDGAFGN